MYSIQCVRVVNSKVNLQIGFSPWIILLVLATRIHRPEYYKANDQRARFDFGRQPEDV